MRRLAALPKPQLGLPAAETSGFNCDEWVTFELNAGTVPPYYIPLLPAATPRDALLRGVLCSATTSTVCVLTRGSMIATLLSPAALTGCWH